MQHECIMNSISKEGKDKIWIWEELHKIGDKVSGNLLLKIVARESHLDTNATTSLIRTKLSKLDKCLPTVGHDITKFNQHVALLLAEQELTNDQWTELGSGWRAELS